MRTTSVMRLAIAAIIAVLARGQDGDTTGGTDQQQPSDNAAATTASITDAAQLPPSQDAITTPESANDGRTTEQSAVGELPTLPAATVELSTPAAADAAASPAATDAAATPAVADAAASPPATDAVTPPAATDAVTPPAAADAATPPAAADAATPPAAAGAATSPAVTDALTTPAASVALPAAADSLTLPLVGNDAFTTLQSVNDAVVASAAISDAFTTKFVKVQQVTSAAAKDRPTTRPVITVRTTTPPIVAANASLVKNGSLGLGGVNTTYRPPTTTQIPDCFSCLVTQHYRLVQINDSCQLVGDFAGCLAKCRLALRPEASLTAAIDFYNAFRQQSCITPGCSNKVSSCFDAFTIYHDGFLSMSLQCGNDTALEESLKCLIDEAAAYPQCVLNPSVVLYFLRAGAEFLCKKELRCFSYGNVYEPRPPRSFVQFSAVSTTHFNWTCSPRTAFDTEICGCILATGTLPTEPTTRAAATTTGRTGATSKTTKDSSSTTRQPVTSVTTRQPVTAPISDCSRCLGQIHNSLVSAVDPCSVVDSYSACISSCRPSLQPQASLASLLDFYNAFRNAGCNLPGCSPSTSTCLDGFTVFRDGYQSASLRCGDSAAYDSAAECLSNQASESPGCVLNPNGLSTYFLGAGSTYLCDRTQRCFDYGNVFEPNRTDPAAYIQSSAIDGSRYPRRCPRGTVFSTAQCTCVISAAG